MYNKLGILGGTFNPVHNGHIAMALGFYRKLGLDAVLLVPVCEPPHKSSENLLPAEERLKMCRAACDGDSRLTVSDVEIKRGGRSYTADTLREIAADYPGTKLYLLMGADMFLTVEKWRCFREIIKYAAVCCAARHEGELGRLNAYAGCLISKYNASCAVVDMPVVDVSSTEVRRRLASHEDVSYLLPPQVLEYIRKNGLYGYTG